MKGNIQVFQTLNLVHRHHVGTFNIISNKIIFQSMELVHIRLDHIEEMRNIIRCNPVETAEEEAERSKTCFKEKKNETAEAVKSKQTDEI